jgi:oxygen-independent coproporphyrinogen III oxidase
MSSAQQPTILSWDVASRYNRPAPRYTSYPPAPAWQQTDAAAANTAYARAAARTGAISLYVHIPFCERMCLYCGCNVIVAKNYDKVARYLAALEREVNMVAERLGPRELVQLHFGGGTPTFLTPNDLDRIISAIFTHFSPAPHAELGIERFILPIDQLFYALY